jgi:excinuclease UvrABC ATPase subunit
MSTTSIEISIDNPGQHSFDRLYEKLESLDQEGLSLSNITGIVIPLMQFTQNIGGMTGSEKKQLVIDVLKKRVLETVEDTELSTGLNMFIDFTLPSIIDSFVALNNGETRIKIKNCLSSLLKKCLGR